MPSTPHLATALSFATAALSALLLPTAALAQITSSAPPSAAPIHVRITRPAIPQIIPPTVFGSFLEPIEQRHLRRPLGRRRREWLL